MAKKPKVLIVSGETGEIIPVKSKGKTELAGFNRFIQINADYADFLSDLAFNHGRELALLLYLEKNANKLNKICVHQKSLCERLKISKSTLSRYIKFLKEKKLIYKQKSDGNTFYIINPDIMWKSKSSDRFLCEFPGSLIINKDKKSSELQYIGKII